MNILNTQEHIDDLLAELKDIQDAIRYRESDNELAEHLQDILDIKTQLHGLIDTLRIF